MVVSKIVKENELLRIPSTLCLAIDFTYYSVVEVEIREHDYINLFDDNHIL